MINKVNPPPQLFLVSSTKSLENDPGGSSGSGLSYEPSRNQSDPDSRSSSDQDQHSEPERVSELNKGAMTEVVIELLEAKEHHTPQPSPGLTTKYQMDQSKTKGLLLNKKAE